MSERELTNLQDVKAGDRSTVSAAVEVLGGSSRRKGLARILPFLGPAFIASIAYMDPGNYATNLQGGAELGYTLLWVVVASNLMAMLVQTLSAKLGIATGRNLAEMCRDHYPRWLTLFFWAAMELVAMATDLAEFLGAALGFYLLFGIPLWVAGLLSAVATFLLLGLERYGFRPLEGAITAFVGVIAVCYLAEMFIVEPNWRQMATSFAPPRFGSSHGVLLAAGILGATVMPHVIFLHSALTQGRVVVRDAAQMKRLFKYEVIDVVVAMGVAGLINAAMLIMAAKTFHEAGMTDVDAIEKAYLTLKPLLGPAAGFLFAVSLLASGLSSSAVGTMSGQVIMQGFLNRHIPIWLRRLVTMAPALIVIFSGMDPTRVLILSQVALSFGLPLALAPLVLFTRRRDIMGPMVNRTATTVAAAAVAAMIVALNVYLLYRTFAEILR
jgi:manganese transport protein